MRPVTRGLAPRIYAKYQDAIGDLEERLGIYCSYCERRLPVSLAVEHVVPKSRAPKKRTAWDNFLLCCANCNSVKGAKPANETDFLWPDRDNTMLAICYAKGGFASLATGLNADIKAKAAKLVNLVGLDRHPAVTGAIRPAPRDKRWQQREEVWAAAELARVKAETIGIAQAVDLVVIAAEGYGFFGVWMTVFEKHALVRSKLIKAFKGTDEKSFDANGTPTARVGGRL